MAGWYFHDPVHGRVGPLTQAQLRERHAQGTLAPDTLVWRDGLDAWQPLQRFAAELRLDMAGSVQRADDAGDSPYAPPLAPLLREPDVQSGGEVVYAGFWKRVAAYVIDTVLLAIVGAIVGAAIGGAIGITGSLGAVPGSDDFVTSQILFQLVGLVLGACYCGWFYASHAQATPGKMAIGIKVVRGSGERIGFWRGFARYFAQIPGGLILGIGYAMAGFTARRQALHDMICDTLVVDKWAYTGHPELQRHELGTLTIVVLVFGGLLLLGFFALIGLAITLLAGQQA